MHGLVVDVDHDPLGRTGLPRLPVYFLASAQYSNDEAFLAWHRLQLLPDDVGETLLAWLEEL